MAMADPLVCRSCGSGELSDCGACSEFDETAAMAGYDPGRLMRCVACGLGQRHPVPTEEALIAMYQATPAADMLYRFEDNAAWSSARRQLLLRHRPETACKVLDIGCHTGDFLAGLPSAWQRHGIESAHEPIQVARDRHQVEIIGDRLGSTDPGWAGQFDAVTLFDVIEHLPDPATGIGLAARFLKPGGILLLSSADMDAWTWRWLGAGHWYLQTPQHLSVVSAKFLQHVARQLGLRIGQVQRIPHRHAPLRVRFRELLEARYWGLRRRSGWYRLPHRLLQSMPGLRDLRHRQSVPWTMTLRDHLLASFESKAG